MSSRMSMLLRDLDMTLTEFKEDGIEVPPLTSTSATPKDAPAKLDVGNIGEHQDYDFLDNYGEEAATVAPRKPLTPPLPPSNGHSHADLNRKPLPNPQLSNFPVPASLQQIMRPANQHPPQHMTQPVQLQHPSTTRDYAAFQTPPPRSVYPTIASSNADDDIHRRMSYATSISSGVTADSFPSGGQSTNTRESNTDEEIAALREQLERAKLELRDQMYVNKVLATQAVAVARAVPPVQGYPAQPMPYQQGPPSMMSASTVNSNMGNSGVFGGNHDKSDTISVSSGKSSKSGNSAWFGLGGKSKSKGAPSITESKKKSAKAPDSTNAKLVLDMF